MQKLKRIITNKWIFKTIFSLIMVAVCVVSVKFDISSVVIDNKETVLNALPTDSVFYTAAVFTAAMSIVSIWVNISGVTFFATLASCVAVGGGIGVLMFEDYNGKIQMFDSGMISEFDFNPEITGLIIIGAVLLLAFIFSIISLFVVKFSVWKESVPVKQPEIDVQSSTVTSNFENTTENTVEVSKSAETLNETPKEQNRIKEYIDKKNFNIKNTVPFIKSHLIPSVSVLCAVLILLGVLIIKPFGRKKANNLFNCGLCVVKDGKKWGYIDKNGTYVINPQFDWADSFAENGLAVVEVDDKYGCINKKGNYVINPQFDSVSSFSDNGLAAVKVDDKWGYINKKGNYVINPQFDWAFSFADNGLAAVKVDDKYGYINKKGTYVINPQFDDGYSFSENGLAVVEVDDKCGYINKKGIYVINPQFDDASSFSDNRLAVVEVNEKWGYINKKGNFVINAQFSSASSFFDDGYAVVSNGKKCGIIDKKGNFIINPMFKQIKGPIIYNN